MANDNSAQDAKAREQIQINMENHPNAMYPYLVRGAKLRCRCGTHIRKLNLPTCHGAYTYTPVDRHPLIHAKDAVPDECIMYFGICEGSIEGSESINLYLDQYDENGEKVATTETIKTGPKCKPSIISDSWQMTHSETGIVRNGETSSRSNAEDSVTLASYLVCQYGGLIEPITSGHENTETAPMANE